MVCLGQSPANYTQYCAFFRLRANFRGNITMKHKESLYPNHKNVIEKLEMPLSFSLAGKHSPKTHPEGTEDANFRRINSEVYYATDSIIKLGKRDIEILKENAGSNKRQRSRLCTHRDINDKLHEMFIVHRKNTYVRPHKHLHKSESLHVIEGSAYMIVFDEFGKIVELANISDYSSGHKFYYRMGSPYYHTLFILSDFMVFHETTNGPFKKSDTIFAPWSPKENDKAAIKLFIKKLERSIRCFLSQKGKCSKVGKRLE